MRKLTITFSLLVSISTIAQKFTEVSNQVGIDYQYPGLDVQEIGAGITILDVNNDGWDDIFQAGGIFPSKLWLNKKGKFIDATNEYGLNVIDSIFVQGAVSGDFDNDGYTDLFIANMGIPPHRGDNHPPILLKNVKGKAFKVVLQNSFTQKGNYPGATWGDINNDGFLDLFVVNYVEEIGNTFDSLGNANAYTPFCLPNQLFLNNSGLSFKNVAKEFNLDNEGCGLACCFTDFDNDNDIDLILLNDFGHFNGIGNRIYRNEFPKQQFIDLSDSLNFYDEFYAMGVGPGDFNNDGKLDYYLTNIGRNRLMTNQLNGFFDVAQKLNVDTQFHHESVLSTSWSGIFFDAENDGDQDLFVAKGYLESMESNAVLDQNKFFINDGNGNFEDRSILSQLNDSIVQRGAATLDYNHDGYLDLVTGVIKDTRSELARTSQKIKLYRNDSDKQNNWIGFKLIGSENVNSDCIGCSVTIKMKNGAIQIKEVDGGSGHNSQSTKVLYFGLGEQKCAKNITIQWLGNSEQEIKELKSGRVYEVKLNGKIKKIY